ncbi:MAG TPA: S8 family serine peptidase, partial [Blastocatellia bacterium]|nr:S8 family serine peptidase [Blastocatellia bacterium]
NVATKMLTERGINVVFSAGNTGPGQQTLNPYAIAPWVISVGATDAKGRLADFSSRGAFCSPLFRPTLVAPGVNLIGLRSSGLSLTGTLGVVGADTSRLKLTELPFYTTASGTSFSAPQVAATIALMLEANPNLTPAQIREILQRTATPLPEYYQHEVGAGMLNAHAAVLESAFPQRRMGMWRAALNRGQVKFINDPSQNFTGTVMPGQSVNTNLNLPENTLLASVQIGWGPMLSMNDLGLSLFDPAGRQAASSNLLNLPGITGKRERVSVSEPASGQWRARVNHTLGIVSTSQSFNGLLEVTRAEYAPLNDISNLSLNDRLNIQQVLRSFVMLPYGNKFYPNFGVTRSALAASLVQGAHVPQYIAGQQRYTDVRDLTTRNFVESIQFNPSGALFPDASGSTFKPDAFVDRLTAAIVLVRAAGLRAEAESLTSSLLTLSDTQSIPFQWRGYVSVALSRGLMKSNNNLFRPQSTLTRLELAQAVATIQRINRG